MPHSHRHALVFSHVAFEDLDSLQSVLEESGYQIQIVDVPSMSLQQLPILETDLLIILGGPIGVYEDAVYPFLLMELDLLRQRLLAQRPTLGICLGAQLMAKALGAAVYAGAAGSEIGWSPLQSGKDPLPAWAEPLFASGVEVLHWHGDTFDLPAGASHLAASSQYPNQAYSLGKFALGLQFHLEVSAQKLERWYVGHTCELNKKQIDIATLRAEGQQKAPRLKAAARAFWKGWLDYIL